MRCIYNIQKSNILLPAKNGVLHIQVRLLAVGDEELAGIGVRSVVGHAEHASLPMFQVLVDFIVKLAAPTAGTALARTSRIAGLHHEAFDVAVEETAIVVVRRGECEEVLRGDRVELETEYKE